MLNVKDSKEKITYSQLILKLEQDLNKLIRGLEIYLADFIEKMICKDFSPDIEEVVKEKNASTGPSSLCSILNFNYTSTCQKIYLKSRSCDIDYIHGKASLKSSIINNNMVLGIDEYLSEKKRNKDLEFIAFKKYYQRIYKGTGCKYQEWVDDIKKEWESKSEEYKNSIRKHISKKDLNNNNVHTLYIFGHSLDITDKDILRDLILNDNIYTTIFYHNKEELGKKITNLVKVIGQDELIRRTGGSTKTIEFKLQQDMRKRSKLTYIDEEIEKS